MKLWEKNSHLNKSIEDYTVGNDHQLDQNLVQYDCKASIAHAKMLKKINILTNQECKKIIKTLNDIIILDKKSQFTIAKEDEDCHTAIENYLTKHLGNTGKKIHTARSRNDQILTALRLYYKDQLTLVIQTITQLITALECVNKNYGTINIPGYTHMQKAMPSSIGLWCAAFSESMKDNIALLEYMYHHIDTSPLGTGAGYGLPLKIDRQYTTELLGFQKIQKNSLYVQNSRGKIESLLLHGLHAVMIDLNKMAMDLLLFSMPEFGYISFPDAYTTGSSIMPQKKNVDALELIRANYHKVVGFEFEINSIIGNLISGYNRDLQLTKEPIMNGFIITKKTIEIMSLLLQVMNVNSDKCNKAMTAELYATKELYDLVAKGVPFREAYKKISAKY